MSHYDLTEKERTMQGLAARSLLEAIVQSYEIERTPTERRAGELGPVLTRRLCAMRAALEVETIALIPESDPLSLLRTNDVLESRSRAILEAMPDHPPAYFLDGKEVERIRGWITHDHLALACRKGITPGRGMQRLFDRSTGGPDWDHLFIDVYAPIAPFSSPGGKSFWTSQALGTIKDRARLAKVLRAQVVHHPKEMTRVLEASLREEGERIYALTPVALCLAGARRDETVPASRPVSTCYEELARQMASNHGQMEIRAKHGSLEHVLDGIAACAAVEHDRRSGWR